MQASRNLRRFRSGKGCDECPARRWYSESGFRYCENGHRIEGFIEFASENDDGFYGGGKTARKEKEVREKEGRQLSGEEARELYLECLQLVLRKQIFWLVSEKHFPPHFESVVRDLWDLRVRNFHGLRVAGESASSMPALKVYNSSDDSGTSDVSARSIPTRRYSWKSSLGERWNMPTLMDTLGLCYLGCLLLRLPYRVGEFFRWAKRNQILFFGAMEQIPREMRDRLPGTYHRTLLRRYEPFSGGELHRIVLDLVRGYQLNYEMSFPELNMPLLLHQLCKELGLPVEVNAGVQALVRLMEAKFDYPLHNRRVYWVDHPDVLLVATVVLVTKLTHPFDAVQRFTARADDIFVAKMDWEAWQKIFAEPPEEIMGRRELENLGSNDIRDMSDAQMDEFLDFFQHVRIEDQQDSRHIAQLFPLGEPRLHAPAQDKTEAEIDQRLREVQRHMTKVGVEAELVGEEIGQQEIPRLGSLHQHYRTEEDLPAPARAFYAAAAELAGITTQVLVAVVRNLERKSLNYIMDKEKRQGEGKGGIV